MSSCRFNPVMETQQAVNWDSIWKQLCRHVQNGYPSIKQAFLQFDKVQCVLHEWYSPPPPPPLLASPLLFGDPIYLRQTACFHLDQLWCSSHYFCFWTKKKFLVGAWYLCVSVCVCLEGWVGGLVCACIFHLIYSWREIMSFSSVTWFYIVCWR